MIINLNIEKDFDLAENESIIELEMKKINTTTFSVMVGIEDNDSNITTYETAIMLVEKDFVVLEHNKRFLSKEEAQDCVNKHCLNFIAEEEQLELK